jgi:hypothetical protein
MQGEHARALALELNPADVVTVQEHKLVGEKEPARLRQVRQATLDRRARACCVHPRSVGKRNPSCTDFMLHLMPPSRCGCGRAPPSPLSRAASVPGARVASRACAGSTGGECMQEVSRQAGCGGPVSRGSSTDYASRSTCRSAPPAACRAPDRAAGRLRGGWGCGVEKSACVLACQCMEIRLRS